MKREALGIAQVAGTFGDGGAQRQAFNLALGLRELGARSCAIALRDAGGFADADRSGLEVLALRADRGAAAKAAGVTRLRRFIRERRLDCLHVHMPSALLYCALATRFMSRPPALVLTWHLVDPSMLDGVPKQRAQLWALRRCRAIFADSHEVAARLGPMLGLDVGVLPNGVPEGPAYADTAAEGPRILWMARFATSKRPRDLVRAAATLKAEGHRFRIVMAGKPIESYFRVCLDETQKLIAELNVGDVITLPGWVDDTAALLRGAAIGAQTSSVEGLSLTLLEQMMAGLAIVATDVGDTARAIEDGHTGLLVPSGDVTKLTDALRRLITDRPLRQRLGAAARQRVLDRYTTRRVAEGALAVYESVLPRGAASRAGVAR